MEHCITFNRTIHELIDILMLKLPDKSLELESAKRKFKLACSTLGPDHIIKEYRSLILKLSDTVIEICVNYPDLLDFVVSFTAREKSIVESKLVVLRSAIVSYSS